VATPRLVGLGTGPDVITLVRHGESVANVADAEAHRLDAERLDLKARDADVELSPTGRDQAEALRDWLADADPARRPDVVISSPFRRAADTARIAVERLDLEVLLDERLRERSLGIFDGLTGRGIRAEHPHEAEQRSKVGKFYYAPPSGESWADVVLRVRSLLGDLRHGFEGARVWMFTHQAVIMSFRYALEGLDEKTLLDIDRDVRIPNASFTRFRREGDVFELAAFADTTAVDRAGAEVTREASQRGRGDDNT
jgi:broad specificity phosphatase PhoE